MQLLANSDSVSSNGIEGERWHDGPAQPGTPWASGYNERFNGTLSREELESKAIEEADLQSLWKPQHWAECGQTDSFMIADVDNEECERENEELPPDKSDAPEEDVLSYLKDHEVILCPVDLSCASGRMGKPTWFDEHPEACNLTISDITSDIVHEMTPYTKLSLAVDRVIYEGKREWDPIFRKLDDSKPLVATHKPQAMEALQRICILREKDPNKKKLNP